MEDIKIINSIKGLSIDMINKVGSGHPGVALGAAPIIYTLYFRHLNIDLEDDKYINRDRFVLSGGHASALIYSMLFYVGYLSLEDLKNFRRINSKTPGHPEIETRGVDISTGPLGQGIANGVGMAIAEKYYENTLSKDIDYYTYVMCGDGDLMEGISYEATSLAGSLNLNKLILLYDSNNVSLDGSTNLTFNEDIKNRFESINWNYIKVLNGNDINEIDRAITMAKTSDKPTIIEIKTIIGEGSMYEGTNKVHGTPLIEEDLANLKIKLNLSQVPFDVDMNLVYEFRNYIKNRCSKKVIDIPSENIDIYSLTNNFYENINEPLRVTNGKIMNLISNELKYFIGGSADVSLSTKTYLLEKGVFSKDNYAGRNIYYGVREHAMGGISNGIASCGIRAFNSTFLAFSDYLKPAIRMSALMNLPVAYIFTHDSITIGSDGATHQPIEQLSMLRNIPNLKVFRPADANEILGCWNEILTHNYPSALVLSRNYSPLIKGSDAKKVSRGAYIVRNEKNRLSAIIIATGTEVNMAINIADDLEKYGINIRVVSMPSMELFEENEDEYKELILPTGYKTIAIEYASSSDWYRYVRGEKYLININNFGKSGTKEEILEYYELDYESVKKYIMDLLK